MTDRNLRYLQKQWFIATPAEEALGNFSKWKEKKLARILRHHAETDNGISDWETWRRDEFDYLLGFYNIIEIAAMVGFINELPASFRKVHLPVLCDGAVRRYYEWHYPIDLPRRLRERMQSGIGYTLPKRLELNAAFQEFLELTKLIERDEDMESFLWALDGGWREDETGECDIDEVKNGLAKASRLAAALQQSPKQRGELDRALNGFCKFMQFCEDLTALIERLKKAPEVSEAMWLAHAYWFRQLNTKLGSELRQAIRSLAQWKVSSGDAVALRTRIEQMETVLQKLALPPLTDWQIRGVGDSTVSMKKLLQEGISVKLNEPGTIEVTKEGIVISGEKYKPQSIRVIEVTGKGKNFGDHKSHSMVGYKYGKHHSQQGSKLLLKQVVKSKKL